MYDIKNLNIWKDSGIREDIFRCREIVLETDLVNRKEYGLSMKISEVFEDMMELVPDTRWSKILERKGVKFKFPMYLSKVLNEAEFEVLDLSQRSNNCLHRAGYKTVGELVSQIEGDEDLIKIRNCGKKSVDEIMEKLFCYQYSLLVDSKKVKYAKRVLELN